MKKELIVQLHASFDELLHVEAEEGVEFWLARDLQKVLGYDRWENFERVIKKAITSCETSGYDASDHFLEATKMVPLGSGAQREVSDHMLTRYACYLGSKTTRVTRKQWVARDRCVVAQTPNAPKRNIPHPECKVAATLLRLPV